jgi:hypothetical protein
LPTSFHLRFQVRRDKTTDRKSKIQSESTDIPGEAPESRERTGPVEATFFTTGDADKTRIQGEKHSFCKNGQSF